MNDLILIPLIILAALFMLYLWHARDMMDKYTAGEIGAKQGEYRVELRGGVYFVTYKPHTKIPLLPFPVATIDKGILEDMGWDTLRWALEGVNEGDKLTIRLEGDNGN